MRKVKYEDILDNVVRIISEKGMKHNVVAERAGLTKQELSNILHSRKLLRVEYVPRIAEAVGVEISDLFQTKDCPTR